MFAILWNWNQRFFGTKDNGVYLAVRILFLVNCWVGCPSSSKSSSGSGLLKYSCRGTDFSSTLCVLRESSLPCAGTSPGRGLSDPPDALFFSSAAFLACFLPTSDMRLWLLLFTVSLRVAHLALLTSFWAAPSCFASDVGAMMLGLRAESPEPFQPESSARPARVGRVAGQTSREALAVPMWGRRARPLWSGVDGGSAPARQFANSISISPSREHGGGEASVRGSADDRTAATSWSPCSRAHLQDCEAARMPLMGRNVRLGRKGLAGGRFPGGRKARRAYLHRSWKELYAVSLTGE